jgi:hypothetical protein
VFVFMHYPPMAAPPALKARDLTHPEAFIQLFDRYQVDYVISGHHHRLARTVDKATTYLISGGGGGRLRKGEYGQDDQSGVFHHAVVFGIHGEAIEEEVHMVPGAGPIEKFWERGEKWLTHWVWPLEKRHPALALGVILTALLGLAVSLHSPWRRRARAAAA